MALDDKPYKTNIQIGTAVGSKASMNTTPLIQLCTLVVKRQKANAESKAKSVKYLLAWFLQLPCQQHLIQHEVSLQGSCQSLG